MGGLGWVGGVAGEALRGLTPGPVPAHAPTPANPHPPNHAPPFHQYLTSLLEELAMDDACAADGLTRAPAELHSYLTRVLYNRRNK